MGVRRWVPGVACVFSGIGVAIAQVDEFDASIDDSVDIEDISGCSLFETRSAWSIDYPLLGRARVCGVPRGEHERYLKLRLRDCGDGAHSALLHIWSRNSWTMVDHDTYLDLRLEMPLSEVTRIEERRARNAYRSWVEARFEQPLPLQPTGEP